MTTAAYYQDEPSYVELFGRGTASAFQNAFVLPSRTYRLLIDASLFPEVWTESISLGFLAEYEAQSRINVILKFATKMLEKSKDIDPIFAKIAKESFWDLI